MFAEDTELLNDFVVESRDGLAEIEVDLLAIEAGGAEIDLDLVNKVFRAVHSIKGASGFLGLNVIGELAHNLEHVLSEIRNRHLVPTSPIVDQLLKSADQLKRLIEDVERSNAADVSTHVRELKRIDQHYQGANAAATAAPALAVAAVEAPVDDAPLGFAVSTEEIEGHRHQGQILEVEFDLLGDREASQLVDLLQRLRDVGTLIDSYIDTHRWSGADHDPLCWRILQATPLSAEQFGTFFSLPKERVRPWTSAPTTVPAAPISTPSNVVDAPSPYTATPAVMSAPAQVEAVIAPTVPAPVVPGASSKAAEHPVAGDAAPAKKGSPADSNIRVNVSVLDRLMNLAGELVLSRNQLLQASGKEDRRALESACGRIDMVTSELQDAIMQTRMQPIGTVFGKFTRVVRDLSQQLGKKCELVIEGKDVELDRTIIEAIGDPLTHLVRNSMDHGLEKPEVRAQAGKNPVGTVTLAARHQEGKVLLSIQDDGAGIDAQRIKTKAVEKGVITAEAAATMSDRDAVQLIFAPGFSTAEQVTAVSGRGVGMDVVKTNIERLGGSVEIETVVGQGTTILVRLPLTLAIIPSLIASCGAQRFAIPQVSIQELVRVRREELTQRLGRVNKTEVLRLRGHLLPLVRLRTIVARPDESAAAPDVINIVVLETGRLRYGLVVDRLHDSEEIVVKPLGRHLKDVSYLAGATVLGDGRVALILDAGGLATRAGLDAQGQTEWAGHDTTNDTTNDERIPTLLFANHPQEWFGVPMAVVARIERIQATQIETVGHREVLHYRGGTLNLLNLEDCITARPREAQSRLYVIVFRHGGRELGLVAPEILDIRDLPANIDTTSFQEPGVQGSAILDGHAVRFLEVFDLGNTQHAVGRRARQESGMEPVYHTPMSPVTTNVAAPHPPTILYAEDSGFFRNKVVKFLREEGWQVIACEDGQEAWEKLNQPSTQLDLILTDIEMPRMTGFELCTKVRRESRWKDVPILAVTSLAADADRAHGIHCGVTDYLVKLDRDQLLTALAKYRPVTHA